MPDPKDTFLEESTRRSTEPGFLGDSAVVNGLLRNFIGSLFAKDATTDDEVDQAARSLAKVFLGEDESYPAPFWNAPGLIDAHLAAELNLVQEDPETVVAHALVELIHRFAAIEGQVVDAKLIREQWQPDADALFEEFTNLFLGVPNL